MTGTPLFSIIIPCYNYGELLPRAVASVVSQWSDDVELLIVNDGSTDDTSAVAHALRAQHGERIRVADKPNGGLSSARNYGIDHSTGTYLTFLDADDELLDGAFAAFRQALRTRTDIGMLIGGHDTRYSDGRARSHPAPTLSESAEERVRAYLLDKKVSVASSYVAIRRDVFDGYRYNEKLRNAEDIPMFAYILANFSCVAVPQSIALMHRHRDSLRHNTTYAEAIGLALVDEVFAPDRMPFQRLKKSYASMRALSLFRTFYQAKKYDEALAYYGCAIRNEPSSLLRVAYARKALAALLRRSPSANSGGHA